MWSATYLAEGMFRNCFLFKFHNMYSMSFSFLMFLSTLPLLKNNWVGLGGKPAAVTYWHSARPIFSTSKTGPSKCWKIFPLRNGRFEEGGGGGVKKETAIGRFAWQRWEWTLSLTIWRVNPVVNTFNNYTQFYRIKRGGGSGRPPPPR